jgi:hypothetical protein
VFDDGPFCLFDRLRIRAGRYDYGKNGKPQSELGRLLSCPYCVGLWIAIPLTLILFPETIIEFILYWFAIAGAQSFLETIGSGRANDE